MPTYPGPTTPGESNARAVRGGIPPPLTTLTPPTVAAGAANFTLHCLGAGFGADAIITMNGVDKATTVVSDTEVTTPVNMAGVVAGPIPVAVRNGRDISAPLTFTVT